MDTSAETDIKNSHMLREVLEGLQKPQKSLPSKYFYDKRGSELFEAICELEEYYLTRTELSIMKNNIGDIMQRIGRNIQLIELGSGSSLKTRLLLEHLPDIHSYIPVEISDHFLADVVEDLQTEYPELNINPVAADYTQPFELPDKPTETRRIAYYPGSTIGNFTKEQAADFIALIANLVDENGGLLIGFDLLKDRNKLIAAYDDQKGVTAAFNKNLLHRLNHELDTPFNIEQFKHKAIFNENKDRIEMHLESLMDQSVDISGNTINFKKGETIHTENSHKYTLQSFRELTKPYFDTVQTWSDPNNLFAIQFLKK